MEDSIQNISYKNNQVVIDLSLDSIPENTREIPLVLNVLKKKIPSIFKNKCYNDYGRSFYEEVQDTETAHLFEHLLLENMCLAKLKYANSASYRGRTLWDKFAKNKLYKILLTIPPGDRPLFLRAYTKSLSLINLMTPPCPPN